jgi:predicted peptidase
MRRIRFLFFLIASLTLCVATAARRTETGFLDRAATVRGTVYKYQVYVPENWSPQQKWPIILFLHGAGERGSDGLAETQVGIGTAIRKDRTRFPAIVVMPQCKPDTWWPDLLMQEYAMATLEAATKEFKGDPKRTYLTGLSMGGYGSWYLAAHYPGRFAAVVPICGGLAAPAHLRTEHPEIAKQFYDDDAKSYEEVARKIGKTPVWIFHGDVDQSVPVMGSRKLNEALKAAGGNARYTEYPGVDHNAWDKAYAEPELMTWLLAQSL